MIDLLLACADTGDEWVHRAAFRVVNHAVLVVFGAQSSGKYSCL